MQTARLVSSLSRRRAYPIMAKSIGLSVYQALTSAASPGIRLFLRSRRMRGKEDPQRVSERFGRTNRPRPEGPLIWIHAASVGESVSALPIIEHFRDTRPDLNILITTGTVTSAQILAERLPEDVIHQFVPVDTPGAVRRFLDHWHPDLALWMESEFWPNLIVATSRRDVPMILINASLSGRSFRSWQRAPALAKALMSGFRACLAQTDEVAARLEALGARNVTCTGNLKYAAPPLPADAAAVDRVAAELDNRQHWLAASTHHGEEEIIAEAHISVRERVSGLLTIIAPRHPERGSAIAKILGGMGLIVARRSTNDVITPSTDIYLADTLGELGIFYRTTAITFMGGSLIPHGGQNPLEPARLHCAILHGPHIFNFQEPIGDLLAAGASKTVADSSELGAAVALLLEDPDIATARAAAARRVGSATGNILDQVLDVIRLHLPEAPA
jgi:3-deoxy-D-manno-octulosonic-acid transferase